MKLVLALIGFTALVVSFTAGVVGLDEAVQLRIGFIALAIFAISSISLVIVSWIEKRKGKKG